MLLDRIDIDAHGPLHCVELGPFAEHLNIVSGPFGSGKTAISRFIRDSLVNREYPLGMLSSSTGRIVWADRNGLVHCRREQDGTATGRRTIEFESRGDGYRNFGSLEHSWLGDICSSTDSSRAVRSIQLPESIVDGVITDTAVTSVARVVSACVRSGLDSAETYRSLPLPEDSLYHDRDGYVAYGQSRANGQSGPDRNDSHDYDRNRGLRQQLADVESELARLGDVDSDHQTLVARRNWLTERLARPQQSRRYQSCREGGHTEGQQDGRWQHRLTQLHDRARDLRARQSELRRWIAEIDRKVARGDTRDSARSKSADYQYRAAISDEQLRRQLDDLDAQMIRWRRALLEVRGLRSAVLASHDQFATDPHAALDESALRRLRLDGFLHAIDRYDRSRSWDDSYPDSYRPIHRLDEIDHRIDSATRQIDWLLERYASPDKVQYAWYETLPESASYRSATTLGESLRAIREDLRQVHRYTMRGSDYRVARANGELEEIRRSEQWLVAAIAQLDRHRESLIGEHAAAHDAEVAPWSRHSHHDHYVLGRDRGESIAQLDRVTAELDACLSEAADLRRSMRSLPVIDSQWYDTQRHDDQGEHNWLDRDALTAELRRIDDRLASFSRLSSLRARRSQLLEQLRLLRRPVATKSPLADAASSWLVRLSAGRLQRIDWPCNRFRDNANSYHRAGKQRTGVTINGRDETTCPAADRALAVMALRMAAGDLLARTGRHVPLVFETHREIFANQISGDAAPRHRYDDARLAQEHGDHYRSNHPIAAALRDYSRAGRQVVMLTSNQDLAAQLERVGARSFQILAERIVHSHRPLWRPHYDAEQYAGPHPHTYGHRDADDTLGYDDHVADLNSPVQYDLRRNRAAAPAVDINRDFDMAWREAYGFYDNPDRVGSPVQASEFTDFARDGVDHRDGYYFADTYTTAAPSRPLRNDPGGSSVSNTSSNGAARGTTAAQQAAAPVPRIQAPVSPFYLSVDSPIDQAPSIDAVAAARLRGLGVSHINHLMHHDSNRLADALGLVNVDAATIRRWQAECRLVCRVPQLRGFDARVLVGCGVTTPAQLASIHPVDLLQQVEGFLATERGQQILLSGSSHELSRITSWIAAANSSSDRDFAALGPGRDSLPGDPRQARRSYYRGFNRDDDSRNALDSAGDENQDGEDGTLRSRAANRRRRILRTMNQRDAASNAGGRTRPLGRNGSDREGYGVADNDYDSGGNGRVRSRRGASSENGSRRAARGYESGRRSRNGRGNGSTGRSRQRRTHRNVVQSEATPRDVVQYERERAQREPREPRENREHDPRGSLESQEQDSQRELRFYLHRSSPVVDAPSIGSRMSERLNAAGIETVNDLLSADPEILAAELDHHRTDADTILRWQQAATLVCCVPMLRGHDAQLLVAADVTTPEELSASDAEDLFGIVDPIARSSDGKRIVRSGKLPDLEEVTDWINFAQHQRELQAA